MNAFDLKNLQYYRADIRRLEERIEVLRTKVESCTAQLTGLPKGHGANDLIETLIEQEQKLEEKLKESESHLCEVEEEIYAIDDLLLRNIFLRKYIDGCSWSQTARKIGGGNTKDSVRKLAYRYSKKRGWM